MAIQNKRVGVRMGILNRFCLLVLVFWKWRRSLEVVAVHNCLVSNAKDKPENEAGIRFVICFRICLELTCQKLKGEWK